MAFDREAARWVRNRRRCEEISWSLFFGAMMKLLWMQSWPLLVATSWGIIWACFLVIGRATFGMPWARPVGPRIGARSAVMIAIVVSILLVPPLGNTGCWLLAGSGAVLGVAAWAVSRVGGRQSPIA
jgi:hypothetical protein